MSEISERKNTEPEEGAVYIEDSEESLKERLSLCSLRKESFDPEESGKEWGAFFTEAFRILEKKENGEPVELCKPLQAETDELCKLKNFWLTELSLLPDASSYAFLSPAVSAWETTLQLLLEAESAKREGIPFSVKTAKDIVYSYLYDYADTVPSAFFRKFLSGEDTAFVRDGVSLFFGNRLKARLLSSMEKNKDLKALLPEKMPSADCPELSSHQGKTLAEFWKKALCLCLLILLSLTLSSCGEKETEEETEEISGREDAYPGTVAYDNEEAEIHDKFGVMHATVLDVQNGEKDGLFIYTLRDEEDPDNAWCLNSQDIGSVVCEMYSGREVAVLFSGDMEKDPDNVSFIAILENTSYKIKKAEGTTVSNMMNSFTIRTTMGVELSFIKDNCKVDKDALSTEGDGKILIYYTEGGGTDHYPFRVYKLSDTE